MLFVAQTLLYVLAVAGVVGGTLGFIFYTGGAMNRARPADMRRRRALLAGACLCGIVASAALGFVGMPALMYLATQ